MPGRRIALEFVANTEAAVAGIRALQTTSAKLRKELQEDFPGAARTMGQAFREAKRLNEEAIPPIEQYNRRMKELQFMLQHAGLDMRAFQMQAKLANEALAGGAGGPGGMMNTLGEMRSVFDRGSTFGMIMSGLKGAGSLMGIGLAAREMASFAKEAHGAMDEMYSGKISVDELNFKLISAVPLIGTVARGARDFADAFLDAGIGSETTLKNLESLDAAMEQLYQQRLLKTAGPDEAKALARQFKREDDLKAFREEINRLQSLRDLPPPPGFDIAARGPKHLGVPSTWGHRKTTTDIAAAYRREIDDQIRAARARMEAAEADIRAGDVGEEINRDRELSDREYTKALWKEEAERIAAIKAEADARKQLIEDTSAENVRLIMADEALAKSIRSPAEIFKERIDELREAAERGQWTWAQYASGVKLAREQLIKTIEPVKMLKSTLVGAAEWGTTAAYSAEAQAGDAQRQQAEQKEIERQQLAKLEEIARGIHALERVSGPLQVFHNP